METKRNLQFLILIYGDIHKQIEAYLYHIRNKNYPELKDGHWSKLLKQSLIYKNKIALEIYCLKNNNNNQIGQQLTFF